MLSNVGKCETENSLFTKGILYRVWKSQLAGLISVSKLGHNH